MADDFTLKWDAQNQQLFGEDPATGDRVAVPFESINADSVNTGRANIDESGLTAFPSSDQPIDTSTDAQIQINTATHDPASELDAANNKVVIANDGTFAISGAARYNEDANWSTGDRMSANFRLNGSLLNQPYYNKSGTDFETAVIPAINIQLTAGDEITFHTEQISGAQQTLAGGAKHRTYLSVTRVG